MKIETTLWKHATIGTLVRQRLVLPMLDPHPGDIILDAACGNGWYSIWLARKGYRTIGFDKRKEPLKSASLLVERIALNQASFMKADMISIPLPDASFDKALCVTSIEHVSQDLRALLELKRVLKKQGKLVLTTPITGRSFVFRKFLTDEFDQVRDGYYPNEIAELLRNAGFNILSQDYIFRLYGQLAWELSQLFKNKHIKFKLFRPFIFRLALMDGISPMSRYKNEIVILAESM